MTSLDAAHESLVLAYREVAHLEENPTETAAALKIGLDSISKRTETLLVLELLPYWYSVPLIPELVDCAETLRDASRARGLLGAIPSRLAKQVIVGEVDRRLDASNADDWVYGRMAELLEDLGYYAELSDLVRRAEGSDNPYIREVGDDYRPKCGPDRARPTANS